MPDLYWHRNDLRIEDNKALYRGAERSNIVPVYIMYPPIHGGMKTDQKAFVEQGLKVLDDKYSTSFDSGLVVKTGEPSEKLQDLAERFNADKVYYNKATDPDRREVAARLQDTDLTRMASRSNLAVEPHEVEFTEDFTEFTERWRETLSLRYVPKPDPDSLANVPTDIPSPTTTDTDIPEPGHDKGMDKLAEYVRSVEQYSTNITDKTSKMSPYISNGMVGPREAVSLIQKNNADEYLNSLIRREWYYHLMENRPETTSQNYRDMDNVFWRDNPRHIKCWKEGRTGVPPVDAGIRQMLQEAWMHPMARVWTAIYFTKFLVCDWRKGIRYFRDKLVDFDRAVATGSWQELASTGVGDGVLVMDPVKQARKQDPKASYIRKYVDELRDLPSDNIYSWVHMSDEEREDLRQGYDIDYPDTIARYDKRVGPGVKEFKRALRFGDP